MRRFRLHSPWAEVGEKKGANGRDFFLKANPQKQDSGGEGGCDSFPLPSFSLDLLGAILDLFATSCSGAKEKGRRDSASFGLVKGGEGGAWI
jgi:hypothetical protein